MVMGIGGNGDEGTGREGLHSTVEEDCKGSGG